MRKIIAFMLLLFPFVAFSADLGKVDVSAKLRHSDGISVGLSDSGNFNIGIAGDGYTLSFDQSDNEMEIGAYGVYLSRSDSKNIGLGYGAGIGIFDGGVRYSWMSNGEHVVGGGSLIAYKGLGLNTDIEWNVSNSDIKGSLGTSLDIWGATAGITSKWDIDNFSYDGLDLSAGYSIPVSGGLNVIPSVSMGLDNNWERGDIKIAAVLSMDFGHEHDSM